MIMIRICEYIEEYRGVSTVGRWSQAFQQRFRRRFPQVVTGTHGMTVSTGVRHQHHVPFTALRQAPVQAQYVAALADGSHYCIAGRRGFAVAREIHDLMMGAVERGPDE